MDSTVVTISDSEEDDDEKEEDKMHEEAEEEEEEAGPHSWPGTLQTRSISPPQRTFNNTDTAPLRAPVMTSPVLTSPVSPASSSSPLLYKPTTFPMTTLFTLVPPGLLGSSNHQFINPFLATQSSQPIPQLAIVNSATTTSKPMSTCVTSSISNHALSNQKSAVTLASIPPEELTPAHHELKEFAEEFKTKRIQLGYTQGAVGQSLAERGYSNFAQSTISRFEQMQLSPSNASAIMIVLKRWLHEAENPDMVSSSNDAVCPPRKRKKRVVYTPQALSVLNKYFQQEPRPNRQIIEMVAQELDLLPEEVRVWFCNKRQKHKMNGSDYDQEPVVESLSPASPMPRRTPSPPQTKFTIEELSKSSASSTTNISSPLSFTSHLTMAPSVPTIRPLIFASRRHPVTSSTTHFTSFMSTKA